MTTLALPLRSVKPTTKKTTRRRPTVQALARAYEAARRKLESLIPGYHEGRPTRRWIERTWMPAHHDLDRAEDAIQAHLNRRGVAGTVVGGRLYLDLNYLLGDLADYRGTGVLVVALEDVEGLPVGPDPADAQHWAERNPDHHTTEETPVEVLGDGPEPDWDRLGEDALAQDSYSRGFLPL